MSELQKTQLFNWSEAPLNAFAAHEPTSFVDGPFGSDLKVSDYAESGVRILQLQNLGDGYFLDDNVKYAPERKAQSLSRCLVRPGDLLIAKMADPLARACIVPPHLAKGLIVADLIKLRLDREHDATFICSAINGTEFRREAERLATGTTRTRISLSTLKRIRLRAPKPKEQRRIGDIVRTLDETTRQSEALIAKYQQIKLGLMHDLFTRGATANGNLRPTRAQAPHLYKDSPLGWIPKEWEVVPLSSVTQFITSGSRGWAEYYSEVGPQFIRIGNLTREHINFRWDSVTRVSLPKFTEGQRTAVLPNDILISITADLGIVAVAGNALGEAYVNQHIALVRPRVEPEVSRFLGHFLSTVRVYKQFLRLNDSGAKAGLNLPAVGKILVVKPLDDLEPKRVAAMLDEVDLTIECHKQEVVKLRQQKHGLMQDLLTGRVRVKVSGEAITSAG
ncbi:MAG: restriction endonuclease subunit S [Nitrospirota bacterium]|mgnify:CR=1 FL=1